jgi:SAM-dependent methyltransferase
MNASDTTHAFDGKAEVYAQYRPDYAPRAIAAIVAIAGLDKTTAIADLGAGTGMLTRHFLAYVGRIFAIEPNDEMRTLARSSLGQSESLRLMRGTAQATGLPDHCVDAVTAGRAIHWFDPGPTQTEIRRILRPGGWLIIVRTPITDAYSSAARERLRDERISRPVKSRPHGEPQVDVSQYFGGDNYVRLTYPCTAHETWPQFLGRMQSFSHSPRPGDPKYDAFERVARETFDGGAVDRLLRIEYATEVLMKQIVPPAESPRSMPPSRGPERT